MQTTELNADLEPDLTPPIKADFRSGLGTDADRVSRKTLVDSRGVHYRDFRKSLAPRYWLVWLHLLAGHATLLVVALGLIAADHWGSGAERSWSWRIAAVLFGASAFGYAIAYIGLFLHEAAHHNIAPGRAWNDRLANLFIGCLTGQDIRAYRIVHFDHHRYLGTPKDTEHTYFEPLDARFFFSALGGVKVLHVLLDRNRTVHAKSDAAPRSVERTGYVGLVLACGALLNFAIVSAAAWFGCWSLAIAWVVGMIVIHPFFAALRQLLEHRDDHARDDIDYSVVPHGAFSRTFGPGPLASTFGGAGFNRHVLHHWDPGVSYTRLADLERFLLDTPMREALHSRTTTYVSTFWRLLHLRRQNPETN